MLAEQHDEWIEGRRYFGLEVLARSRTTTTTGSDNTASAADPALPAAAEPISA